jgi:hypothetical protein
VPLSTPEADARTRSSPGVSARSVQSNACSAPAARSSDAGAGEDCTDTVPSPSMTGAGMSGATPVTVVEPVFRTCSRAVTDWPTVLADGISSIQASSDDVLNRSSVGFVTVVSTGPSLPEAIVIPSFGTRSCTVAESVTPAAVTAAANRCAPAAPTVSVRSALVQRPAV